MTGDVDLERDGELVLRCQAGDSTAFADLYVRYLDRLTRHCRRYVRDDHSAEEMAQEAFTRAYAAMPTFTGDRFYPWLTVIARNLCLMAMNRSAKGAEVNERLIPVAPPSDPTGDYAEGFEDAARMGAAFDALPDKYRAVLTMRDLDGMAYREMAAELDLTAGAVESLLWRARRGLRLIFEAVAA